ncbi:agglutinin-2-like [Eucalyptus grandis]|uniref:agglutinin-2-like n=1 Tax=Eucalyptus grandis TaxID=71139 RepID=UPI00192ECC4A|nr:agglutinin-2-like [Eucalyptus grandis]
MPILPNSGGGFLGLFNASMASEGPRNRIVMVGFNTYVNPEFDPPVHHIGINKNGLSSVVYIGWDPSRTNGDRCSGGLQFHEQEPRVSRSFEDKRAFQIRAIPHFLAKLILRVSFPNQLGSGFQLHFGFYVERHIINSWEFTSDLDVVDPPPLMDKSAPKIIDKYDLHALTDIAKEIGALPA